MIMCRYALAIEVDSKKENGQLVLTPVSPARRSVTSTDLIYFTKSTDYCFPDKSTGSYGTKHRCVTVLSLLLW